jgi:hypothetical protein
MEAVICVQRGSLPVRKGLLTSSRASNMLLHILLRTSNKSIICSGSLQLDQRYDKSTMVGRGNEPQSTNTWLQLQTSPPEGPSALHIPHSQSLSEVSEATPDSGTLLLNETNAIPSPLVRNAWSSLWPWELCALGFSFTCPIAMGVVLRLLNVQSYES